VDVSPDLKKAKIYFSVYNSTKKISDINILINKKRKFTREEKNFWNIYQKV